ncbi:MAG: sulfurtransferase [Halodesulfurarchaeum sp.]
MTSRFISPDQLVEGHEDVVIVDVRRSWEYENGHIPGAVNIPFDDFRDPTDTLPGKLPTPGALETLLGENGISNADRTVSYGGEFGVYASRFLVTMEIFGHDIDLLQILDSDYDAWTNQYTSSTESPNIPFTQYHCERTGSGPLITANELEAALDTDAVIVDTRDPLEYDTVHVPGAINFQWRDLVDENDRQLKPRSRCREILSEHDITFDRPVRLYCNTARRLSFVYTVLRELGHHDVAFYEGGINAWAEYGGPVETT